MPAWSIDVAPAEQRVPGAPPRLWKVSGGGIPADRPSYIMGITHVGLPSEYDDYLTRVVLPAAGNVQELIYEGAGGGGDASMEPPCPATPEVNPNDPRIKAARKAVEFWSRKYIPYTMEVVRKAGLPPLKWTQVGIDGWARLQTSYLTELGLMATMRVYGGVFSRPPVVPPVFSTLIPRGSVVSALLKAIPEGTRITPADTEEESANMYCSMGATRLGLFQSRMRQFTPSFVKTVNWKQAAEETARFDQEFRVLLLTGRRFGFLDDLSPADQVVLCDRNKNWIRKFFNSASPQPTFLALGVSHLYPVHHDNVTCGGLLGDLRGLGMSVDPVE
jgi:hypothetical protein